MDLLFFAEDSYACLTLLNNCLPMLINNESEKTGFRFYYAVSNTNKEHINKIYHSITNFVHNSENRQNRKIK